MTVRERSVNYAPVLFEDDVQSTLLEKNLLVRRNWPVGSQPYSGWWSYHFEFPTRRAADLQRCAREIADWTGWSTRKMASVFQTSHTTIRNAQLGRALVEMRSGELARRLEEAHPVVARLYEVAARGPDRLARALERVDASGESALGHLREGRTSAAYLAGLDAMRRREEGDLLVGERPAVPGEATSPLTE